MKHHPVTVALVRFGAWLHVALYRLLRGNLPHRLLGEYTILLTTTGRRSGKPRVTPLCFVREGDDLFVIGSWGGSERHPHWYLNLRDNPRVRVEDHGRTLQAVAMTIDDDATYARIWQRFTAFYPTYELYRKRTNRRLPIVRLSPLSG
jgi:deazaflavin-dependent oxidoreductase (nitroreductase family)